MAPFDEIVANPSDLKHVAELLRCSDGLGVVVTVGLHHLCVFYWRLYKCRSGLGRRLVTFLIWRRMTDRSVTKVDSSMQRAASLANARDLDGEAWHARANRRKRLSGVL